MYRATSEALCVAWSRELLLLGKLAAEFKLAGPKVGRGARARAIGRPSTMTVGIWFRAGAESEEFVVAPI